MARSARPQHMVITGEWAAVPVPAAMAERCEVRIAR
jgi:hypothetical protein